MKKINFIQANQINEEDVAEDMTGTMINVEFDEEIDGSINAIQQENVNSDQNNINNSISNVADIASFDKNSENFRLIANNNDYDEPEINTFQSINANESNTFLSPNARTFNQAIKDKNLKAIEQHSPIQQNNTLNNNFFSSDGRTFNSVINDINDNEQNNNFNNVNDIDEDYNNATIYADDQYAPKKNDKVLHNLFTKSKQAFSRSNNK